MATVGEAIAATLIAQWNVGTGGTRPDPIQYLVERPERDPNPTVADAIYVWLPLRRTFDPIDVAEVYRNVTYTLRIVCHTKTSSARQLEIENEVDRILNSGTVITGATRQRVKEINDISNRSYSNLPKYISEVIMEVFTAMEVSATAYGTATTTTLTTDILIVNTHITGLGLTITQFLDEDNMASDAADAFVSQQSIKAYVDAQVGAHDAFKTFTGITNDVVADQPEDSITFTSANNRLTIVGTTASDTVTFTIDESKIDHDALANFVAAEHKLEAAIDHDALTNTHDLTTDIDHDALNNFVGDEHIAHSGVDVTAGAGLTGGGDISATRTLAVGAGTGITVNANDIQTDDANIDHNALSNYSAARHFLKTEIGIDDLDDTTLTGAQLEALLMFGAANATWVPMTFIGVGNGAAVVGKLTFNTGLIENIDGTDIDPYYQLALPTVKVGLKLYVDDIKVGVFDADAGDYITEMTLYGMTFDTITAIDSDPTNVNSQQEYTWTRAPSDVSAHDVIYLRLDLVCTNAADFNLAYASALCYYAT